MATPFELSIDRFASHSGPEVNEFTVTSRVLYGIRAANSVQLYSLLKREHELV